MKKITNVMIFLGLVIICYPLVSYTGKQKVSQETLDILSEPDALERERVEREHLKKAIEEARKQDGSILKIEPKNHKDIRLDGKKVEDWSQQKKK